MGSRDFVRPQDTSQLNGDSDTYSLISADYGSGTWLMNHQNIAAMGLIANQANMGWDHSNLSRTAAYFDDAGQRSHGPCC